MFGGFIIGLIFGACSSMYYLVHKKVANTKKMQKCVASQSNVEGEILFLNILILDKSEAIEKNVKSK